MVFIDLAHTAHIARRLIIIAWAGKDNLVSRLYWLLSYIHLHSGALISSLSIWVLTLIGVLASGLHLASYGHRGGCQASPDWIGGQVVDWLACLVLNIFVVVEGRIIAYSISFDRQDGREYYLHWGSPVHVSHIHIPSHAWVQHRLIGNAFDWSFGVWESSCFLLYSECWSQSPVLHASCKHHIRGSRLLWSFDHLRAIN